MSEAIRKTTELGQSLWLDSISRDLLESGALKSLVDAGLGGLTSNPAIFEQALRDGARYDAQIRELAERGKSAHEIYEAVAVTDIQAAADVLRPVYDQTQARDGYVSLEVQPNLAHDTDGTIEEGRRLWQAVDRPNLMIKVPATDAGLPAITALIAGGINVNVTLIFSRAAYGAVMDAYLKGLEQRHAAGESIDRLASVASFFVSRVDSLVDKQLETKGQTDDRGQAAIANAKLAYQDYKQIFAGPRWEALQQAGARVQRPLWASTSTKDPSYPDTMYVDALIGPDTVNTVPPSTLDAFRDHGTVAATLESRLDEANSCLKRLADLGIDMVEVTDQLLSEGISKFATPFETLLTAIEEKRAALVS